jgi:hypothetical protein
MALGMNEVSELRFDCTLYLVSLNAVYSVTELLKGCVCGNHWCEHNFTSDYLESMAFGTSIYSPATKRAIFGS